MANQTYEAGDLSLVINAIDEETNASLDALIQRLSTVENYLKGIGKTNAFKRSGGGKRTARRTSVDKIWSISKLAVGFRLAVRMGQKVAQIVQAGSDYHEVLNLWQVAMRGNLDMADEFVAKMNRAYGISTTSVMNAQATFKNMIGSLGQISDETAYKLSEALVQMTADYASLYNRTLSSAIQNMQSMLAGQVRPIRSAGLDITETSLYQYYQKLGGTKSMRNLNRTEKQLLSILAVYKQMGRAGALGDMSKTIESFANQSRMMAQYWEELKTWSGLILKDWLEQAGVLTYINATIITITNVLRAIAKSKGIGEENYISGLFETAEATNQEVDELKGKLLDFDKFRALNGAGEAALGIDQKVLDAIAGYSSTLDNTLSNSQKLADQWTEMFVGEGGALTEFANDLLVTLRTIVVALGYLVASKTISSALSLAKSLGTIAGGLGTIAYIVGAGVFILGFEALRRNWENLTEQGKTLIPVLSAIAGLASAISIGLSTGNWLLAMGVGTALAGASMYFATNLGKYNKTPNYENGASDIDSGTVFRAGEFGKVEAVYTAPNGKANVANVRQMEQAFFNALSRHTAAGNDKIVVQAILDGEVVYQNTTSRANARGNTWAKR